MGVHIESKAPESQLKNPSRCINYDLHFTQVVQPLLLATMYSRSQLYFWMPHKAPIKGSEEEVIMFTSVRPPEIYSDVKAWQPFFAIILNCFLKYLLR